jgi:hypothetical protein
VFLSSIWRRRVTSIILVVLVQAGVLVVTYRAVVVHGRTLLTGSYILGTEGTAPPYGYPGPPLSGWNEIDAGASAWFLVPQIAKAHLEVSSGELPLWNANVMLGAPLAADGQSGIFNPLTWPLLVSPTPGVWDTWLLSRLLMASLLCTLLAWYLGLRLVPATIAGLIFMMSGVFQLRTTTIQAGIMAMLPLVILGAEMCLRRPSRLSAGVLAVAVASSVLFGMPEESFVCLAFGAVYFVVRFAAAWFFGRRPPRAGVLYAAFGGAVVGILLSLPLLAPLIQYIGLSYNLHSGGGDALQVENARQILSLVGPHWNAMGPHPTLASGVVPVDNWFGVGALFLAMLGLGSSSLPRGTRVLLIVSAVAIEAKAVGFPGWWEQFVGNLPVITDISLWAYSGVIVSLAVALLAGAGLQRIQVRKVKAWHVGVASLVLGVAIAAAAPIYLSGAAIRWTQIALTGIVLLVVATGAVVAGRRPRWSPRLGVLMAAGGVVAELIVMASPELPLPVSYSPLTPTPTTVYLQQVDPSGTGRTYSANATLYPDTSEAFNLDDIRDLDALYIERTYEYMKLFVAPDLTDRFDGLGPNAADVVNNPFLNALNVEYILVGPALAYNAAELPTNQFRLVTVAADGIGVYRNLDASPRAQVVFNAARASSQAQAIAMMSGGAFNPTQSAVIEVGGGTSVPTSDAPPVPARIEEYQDDEVVIKTTTTQPGSLVLADAYYPGWEAYLDGKPVAIHPADLALRSVIVPAGTHTVVMRYQPSSFLVGAAGLPAGMALFGVGGWGVPAVLGVWRRRRRGDRGEGRPLRL